MFAKQYGVERLLDCLEKNEHDGVAYHYSGSLQGDYDVPRTEDAVIEMILHGK